MSGEWKSFRQDWIRAAVLLSIVGCLAVSLAGAAGDPQETRNEARRSRIALYSGGAMVAAVKDLGVGVVMEKSVVVQVDEAGPDLSSKVGSSLAVAPSHADPQTDQPPASANNTSIRYFPNTGENEPSVAVNPRNPKYVVAGTHFSASSPGNRCVAHYSRDGGKSWNPIPIFMRQLTHQSTCSDPVLAYAPDGRRVYYAYMEIDFSTTLKILVSYSDDDGRSWTGPFVALSSPGGDYDKPWIGTHVSTAPNQANRNWVYVTATRFDFAGPCHIDFARSSDKGISWSAPATLDTSGAGFCGSGPTPVVQGSRPNGGLGGDVIVAWYHSGPDGWLEGSFNIRTRYSSNHGATFGPVVVAATENYELPFWLGPDASYHRFWGGMFPDVEIAPNGSAHIAYIYDPEANPGGFSTTSEDGDFRYIGSTSPPYAAWSAPVTVNDDASGKAQGWATLEADSNGSQTFLYALWEDHRNSAADNRAYDVFWSKKVGAGAWEPNGRLTDAPSLSDFIFVGDYYDVGIDARGDNENNDNNGSGRHVYGIWTDRRDEPGIFHLDDDIWGGRLPLR